MGPSIEELTSELIKRKIKPSYQRIKILEYLINNRCHPTAEQIFNEVHKDIPTLSRSTVYNTLNLFMEADMLRIITIEDNETRYEIGMHDHGHFKCQVCGEIYDFDININALATDDLNGFKISDKNVYFNGICPKCI